MVNYLSYLRVSTARQGESGLGLEAQRKAVADFINGNRCRVIAEYVEVESGRRNDRPQLLAALTHCRDAGAVLVVAKLDRLSRNATFLLTLRDSHVEFVAADMPDANRLTVGIMALVAEDEADRISQRTKAALAAAKERGIKLGGMRHRQQLRNSVARRRQLADQHAAQVRPIISEIQRAGLTTYEQIANALSARGIKTARGGRWHAATVRAIMLREAVS
jgi:DNA invertase Pin-like site-specific DNA recombinase